MVQQCREDVTARRRMLDIVQTSAEVIQARRNISDKVLICMIIVHKGYQKCAYSRKNCVPDVPQFLFTIDTHEEFCSYVLLIPGIVKSSQIDEKYLCDSDENSL